MSRFFNKTTIVLIPKVPVPEKINQFRPISLCTVLYKLVTKVIINRLKVVMQHLTAPNQVSFVPGRQITGNIILAQEVIHTMRNCKNKKGGWL